MEDDFNQQPQQQQRGQSAPISQVELIEFWSEPAVRDLDKGMEDITRDLTIGNLDKVGVVYVNNCLSLCEDITEMAKRALFTNKEENVLWDNVRDEKGNIVKDKQGNPIRIPVSTKGAEALKALRNKIYKATITYTQVNRSRDGFERRQQTTQRQETSFKDMSVQKRGIMDSFFPKKQQNQ